MSNNNQYNNMSYVNNQQREEVKSPSTRTNNLKSP